MHYKTIVLELLEQRTELHQQLQKTRQLLPTMEALATELRDRHLALTESMEQAHPSDDPSQIPAQALELAVKELEDRLPSASQQGENEALSLDQAMASIRSHTSRD
jgi:hypothetical protein